MSRIVSKISKSSVLYRLSKWHKRRKAVLYRLSGLPSGKMDVLYRLSNIPGRKDPVPNRLSVYHCTWGKILYRTDYPSITGGKILYRTDYPPDFLYPVSPLFTSAPSETLRRPSVRPVVKELCRRYEPGTTVLQTSELNRRFTSVNTTSGDSNR